MKDKAIVSEVVDKISDYENNMGNFFQEYNTISDNFTLKPKSKRNKGYSNYRTAETHRAGITLGSFMYRGLTANDPFFELRSMDMIGKVDPSVLFKIDAVMREQLKYARFKQNLFPSCIMASVMGTAVVQQPFYDVQVSAYRRLPVTGFVPRSMLTTYFDRNAASVDSSDFIINIDMMSDAKIINLQATDPTEEQYKSSGIKALIDDADITDWKEEVRQRLSSAGYTDTQMSKYREVSTYSGKLDCYGDGKEYIVMVGNRKHLIAMYENPSKCGMRPFRVHRYIPWELELLGYGVGLLLGNLQNSIDNNRQKYHDRVAVATMGINLVNKYGSISPSELAYFQNHVIATEDMAGVMPLPMDYNGINAGMKLEEKLVEEFRAASGAVDSLQAIATDATATEASLVQNSAVRNISVHTELFAEDIVRPALEYMHDNNGRNLSYPFVLNVNGEPQTIYPNDMYADVDFEIKTVTDKNFTPKRARNEIEFLQILTSTKSILPPEMQSKVAPIIEGIINDFAKNMGIDMAGLKNEATRTTLPMGMELAQAGIMQGMNAANGSMGGIQNGIEQLEQAV